MGRVEVILVDTHVLVWWTSSVLDRLSATARQAIVEADSIGFSVITAWEIGTLAARGRIDIHRDPEDWLRYVTGVHGLIPVPLSIEIAFRGAQLQQRLRDPIDCLIAATALAEGVPLVTKDERIQRSGVVATIW